MWKKRLKIFGKIILFSGIILILLTTIYPVFSYKGTGGGGGFQRMYDAPEGTIDVMFFGDSHAHCTMDEGLLWKEYGISGYTLSAGNQMIDNTYYFVREAINRVKPKVVVVETHGAVVGALETSDEISYRNSLDMKWSKLQIAHAKYLERNRPERFAQLALKIPIIHSRYQSLSKRDFVDEMYYIRGYRGSRLIESFEPTGVQNEYGIAPLEADCEAFLCKLIEETQNSGVKLILVTAPYLVEQEEQMRLNRIGQIADQYGVPYINFNHMYDELDIEFSKDFRDSGHVNNDGAKKVSSYIGELLSTYDEVQDHRGDRCYRLWEENALYLDNKEIGYKLMDHSEDVNDYLNTLYQETDDHTVIISMVGNHAVLGDALVEGLATWGITKEGYEAGGTWVFRNKELVQEFTGAYYEGRIPLGNQELYVRSNDQTDQILGLNTQYQSIENGMVILTYDEHINRFVDIAADDVFLGLQVTHTEILDE